MQKIFISLLYLQCICSTAAYAQISIGTAVPDHSSALEIRSTSKGLLIPRMNTSQRTAVVSPAAGLQVYDTSTKSLWYYNGTVWVNTPEMPNDASSGSKGIIQLAGDLTGSAAVPIIADHAVTTDHIKDGTVSNIDLAAGTGGIYKGSGTLAGNTIVEAANKTLSITGSSSNIFTVAGTTFSVNASNQTVGIGTNSPDSRAILDLSSTTKGLLVPRMTTAERNLITSPANGMIIYNKTTNCIDIYSGSSWFDTCSSNPSGYIFQIIGDIKYGLQKVDHNGWILLDGRPVNTLTVSQQINAASLGIGSTLPSPKGRMPIGAGSSYTLLASGGNNKIFRNNLPNVPISGSSPYVPAGTVNSNYTSSSNITTSTESHNHSVRTADGWDGGAAVDPNGMATRYNYAIALPIDTHSHSVNLPAISSTFQGTPAVISFGNISLNNNNAQTNFQPSYLALNTFLYLGI